jgi:CelD/BcsL family acetyltransferase involved in cellulose biosynthesis
MTIGSATHAAHVDVVDPRTHPSWASLARHPEASLFTSPPFITAVCRTYGFTPEARIAVASDGRPVGGIAWVPISDLCGDRLSSLPFSDRAEPLATPALWRDLADEPLSASCPLTIRCFAGSPPVSDPRLSVVGEAAWHGTPLDAPIEEIHRHLHPAAQRNVRAATRHEVALEISTGLDAVRRFHALHVRTRKYKYRMLAQPLAFFENIWDAFSATGEVVTFLASVDDDLAAGALFLRWNDVLYYKFAASSRDHLGARPNDLICWSALKWASDRGSRLVDWGLSDLDQPGLLAYKRKWASVERRIVTMRSRHAPRAVRPGAAETLAKLTDLLTDDDVPDDVTARAGALLYRHFC